MKNVINYFLRFFLIMIVIVIANGSANVYEKKVEVKKMENMGKNPIVITSPIVRIYFKRLTEEYYRDLVVISYNEIGSDVELQSVGMITA
mgnify:CR=1 FL=1